MSEATVEEAAPEPCCQCVRCKAQTCKGNVGSSWIGSDRVCDACALTAWSCKITFVFDWGLPAWVEPAMRTKKILNRLQHWFPNTPCVVYFVNRRDTETLRWQYHWNASEHTKPPRPPYSYRGYCAWGKIVLIVDDKGIETPESLEWLLYHELGHHEQQLVARMSDEAWTEQNRIQGTSDYDWQDDAKHEADAEEQHVNRVATAFMGGKEYARPWWRPRVKAALAGEPLPDPHAPVVAP